MAAHLPLFARLIICASVTLGLTISEFVMSHYTHSITLLVVANQSFYNLITLVIGATSIALMKNNAEYIMKKSTYGWHRVEVVGGLSSLVFLGSLSFATLTEALQTMFHREHLDVMHQPINIFILAFVHVLTWFSVLTLIGGYTHQQRQMSSDPIRKPPQLIYESPKMADLKMADIIRDLASCALLMLTAALVHFIDETEHEEAIKFIDPCFALVSIGIIVLSSLPHGKRLALILLLGTPEHIDVEKLSRDILFRFPGDVLALHEFHIWSLMHSQVVATLHVTYKDFDAMVKCQASILDLLKSHGITQITIQPEWNEIGEDVENVKPSSLEESSELLPQKCLLKCKEAGCSSMRCCKSG